VFIIHAIMTGSFVRLKVTNALVD